MPSTLGHGPRRLDSFPRVFSLLLYRKATAATFFLRSCGLGFLLILVCHRYSSFLHIHKGPSPACRKAPHPIEAYFLKVSISFPIHWQEAKVDGLPSSWISDLSLSDRSWWYCRKLSLNLLRSSIFLSISPSFAFTSESRRPSMTLQRPSIAYSTISFISTRDRPRSFALLINRKRSMSCME